MHHHSKLPYEITGQVVKGKHLGSTIGFPTANIHYPSNDLSVPPDGVYVGVTLIHSSNKSYLTVLNQGRQPTIPSGKSLIEAHLLDYCGDDLYDETLTVTYYHHLRNEVAFDSIDQLKLQLKMDCVNAENWATTHSCNLLNQTNDFKQQKKNCETQATHDTVVEFKNVRFQYEDDDSIVLDDINLSFERGSFTAVLGHNGSGKSTLAKLIGALYMPTAGQITVCGMDTATEEPVWNIRRKAGIVFQNPDNQIVSNVVREDVAFGLENIGVPQPEMLVRIDEALSQVQMSAFADSAPHMLSGGQKQRVAVAGVLAMQPEVMIFDESTAMLDPKGRKDVFDTVKQLNKDKHITVIWITHFMEEAAQADRVVVIDRGKIAMDANPREVFDDVEKVISLGLDVPPMAQLAKVLRAEGLDLPKGILFITEMVKELGDILCR